MSLLFPCHPSAYALEIARISTVVLEMRYCIWNQQNFSQKQIYDCPIPIWESTLHSLTTRTYFWCVSVTRTKENTLKSIKKYLWICFYMYTYWCPQTPDAFFPSMEWPTYPAVLLSICVHWSNSNSLSHSFLISKMGITSAKQWSLST